MRRMFLVINEDCGSRCTLCDYWRLKSPRELPVDMIRHYIPSIISSEQVKRVCVTGGEPTRHAALGELLSCLKDAGCDLTLTTSTERLDAHFHRVRDVVDNYLISLDAATRGTYRLVRGV